MLLVVTIRCARCGASGEVHVAGPWDIKDVHHDCPDLVTPRGKEVDITQPKVKHPIRVKFKPERPFI